MRRVKQIGVDHVLMGGPTIPWDGGRHPRPDRAVQGRRAHPLQPDDLGVRRRDLRAGRGRRADRAGDRVDSCGGEGRPAGDRIQLLRAPAHGGLQGGEGPCRCGLHRVRLRAVEEPAAQGRRRHPHARRPAEARRALPESRGSRSREGERPPRAPPERSAGAAQPRFRTAHGHGRPLEAVSGSREEPLQRHDVRLRRDPRDGRGSRSRSAATSANATSSTTSTSATSSSGSPTSTTPRCSWTTGRSTCSR